MDYSKLTDSQLIALVSEGNASAEELLTVRYFPLVKKAARSFFIMGGDFEDLTQEGCLGLISAIREYSAEENCSFQSFAEKCIRNRIITAIRSASSNKFSPLNSSLSIDTIDLDTLSDSFQSSAEEILLNRERVDELSSSIRQKLSKMEIKVLSMYLEGLSYADISSNLGKPLKSVDNAVQRIRKKFSSGL